MVLDLMVLHPCSINIVKKRKYFQFLIKNCHLIAKKKRDFFFIFIFPIFFLKCILDGNGVGFTGNYEEYFGNLSVEMEAVIYMMLAN